MRAKRRVSRDFGRKLGSPRSFTNQTALRDRRRFRLPLIGLALIGLALTGLSLLGLALIGLAFIVLALLGLALIYLALAIAGHRVMVLDEGQNPGCESFQVGVLGVFRHLLERLDVFLVILDHCRHVAPVKVGAAEIFELVERRLVILIHVLGDRDALALG